MDHKPWSNPEALYLLSQALLKQTVNQELKAMTTLSPALQGPAALLESQAQTSLQRS